MQVVLLKMFLCNFRYTPVHVFIWVIGDIHLYIAQELVIFGKHCNNRDLGSAVWKPLSRMFVMTHRSGQSKCPYKTSDRALVDGRPWGCSTWHPRPSVVVIKKTGAAQTILRAISFVIVFLHTCDEWILSKSRVPLCYPTRFRGNRGKRNPYDWRTPVHRRWCARLAGTMSMGIVKRREVRVSLTSIEASILNWLAVRSDSHTNCGPRTFPRPYFPRR